MSRIVGILLVCLLTAFYFGEAHGPQKLLLSVYYESACSDSKDFILSQLVPAITLLKNHVKLRLVPFGKSKSINYGVDGFQCQHGPKECLGNIIQDCALDLMKEHSDFDKTMYVACEMKTKAGAKGDLKCAKKSNLSANDVHMCVNYGNGVELQLESEHLTKLVQPTFIPTITLDGIFDQQIQDFALIDLTGTLCSVLKETRECAHYYNNLALNNLFAYSLHL